MRWILVTLLVVHGAGRLPGGTRLLGALVLNIV